MNILYYIPSISQSAGGIRQYACALLKTLAEDTEHTYYVLHNVGDEVVNEILKDNPQLIAIPAQVGQERFSERLSTDATKLVNQILKSRQKKQFGIGSYVNRICRKYRIDAVHCPYQHAPYTSVPVISTMHDVQELHLPYLFTPLERAERATIFMGIAERARHIVVSFEHVRQDMIRFFQRTPENVSVCALSLGKLWFEGFSGTDIIPAQKLGVPETYCLLPAATWPHKNHIHLIEAIARLRDEDQLLVNLVCTGHHTPHFSAIREKINQLGLDNQITFLNIVDEVTLYSLYKQARAVVIPTIYEAGSFPLYESIFLNVPVICSSVTSLPETIGDQQFVFNPLDVPDIADHLKQIVKDDAYRAACLANNEKAQMRLRDRNPLQDIKNVYLKVKSAA